MPPAVPFCPRCRASPVGASGCAACGLAFRLDDGLIDVLGAAERESRAAAVERFYTKSPFPGYGSGENAQSLLDRSRRAPFLAALDVATPVEARVLDCGSGTSQLAAFLALAGPRRTVIAIDGCRASLEHANEFRRRAGIANLQLVRGDLFDLPVAERDFDFVISRGVVHHTPDPDRAISCVAATVAPGGVLLLGFYETLARAFHRARRGLATLVGREVRALDPVLRRRDLEEEKKRIWIDDQYRHPLEHVLPLPRVIDALARAGLAVERTIPPLEPGARILDPAPPLVGSTLGRRVAWMLAGVGDPDAGLVFVVARRG